MIAAAGHIAMLTGPPAPLTLNAEPSLRLRIQEA